MSIKRWLLSVETVCVLCGCHAADTPPSEPSTMSSVAAPPGSAGPDSSHTAQAGSRATTSSAGANAAMQPAMRSSAPVGGAVAAAAGAMASLASMSVATPAGTAGVMANSMSSAGQGAAAGHGAAGHAMAGERAVAPAGGGAGADSAGDACTSYCEAIDMACQGDNQQYVDQAACMSACAGFATNGTPGTMRGNTLQCRQSHVANVVERGDPPAIHCNHAGPGGGGACS
jgi:hypothetical protein